MSDELLSMISSLRDGICPIEETETLCCLFNAGQLDDTIARLKTHRANFLEEAHDCQAKVDHVDFLIHKIEQV